MEQTLIFLIQPKITSLLVAMARFSGFSLRSRGLVRDAGCHERLRCKCIYLYVVAKSNVHKRTVRRLSQQPQWSYGCLKKTLILVLGDGPPQTIWQKVGGTIPPQKIVGGTRPPSPPRSLRPCFIQSSTLFSKLIPFSLPW